MLTALLTFSSTSTNNSSRLQLYRNALAIQEYINENVHQSKHV